MNIIIRTRYRDIPHDEIECHQGKTGPRAERAKRLFEHNRGRAIYIRMPAENRSVWSGCNQPRFVVVDENGVPKIDKKTKRHISVCWHIAEIGD